MGSSTTSSRKHGKRTHHLTDEQEADIHSLLGNAFTELHCRHSKERESASAKLGSFLNVNSNSSSWNNLSASRVKEDSSRHQVVVVCSPDVDIAIRTSRFLLKPIRRATHGGSLEDSLACSILRALSSVVNHGALITSDPGDETRHHGAVKIWAVAVENRPQLRSHYHLDSGSAVKGSHAPRHW